MTLFREWGGGRVTFPKGRVYINGLRIEVPSFYFTFTVDKFPLSLTVSEILLTGREQKNDNFKTLTHFNAKLQQYLT
jgi:hypothetical protein